MSIALHALNLTLRVTSSIGLEKLLNADDITHEFRKKAARLDLLVSLLSKKRTINTTSNTDKRLTIYNESKESERHILYFHGSGFIADLPKTFHYWSDELANINNATVYLLDYPLAPEHPFPLGLDACVDAYKWMVNEKNISPNKIVIGGDSAGGNLVLATLLKLKQEGLPQPACAFALSPSLDLTLSSQSMFSNQKSDFIGNHELLKKIVVSYAPNEEITNELISPLFGDCKDLAPLHLQTSTTELLRDDCICFYEKFKHQTSIELELCKNTPHCHQIFSFLPESKPSRRKIQQFIKRHGTDKLIAPLATYQDEKHL
jgi:monoterpene epsilon-lactone hydrolase